MACAGAALLAVVPAWAVDEIEKKTEQTGMPQMDASFFPSQIFWLVITFAVLYFLMKRLAIPEVERVQEKRHAAIAADLAAAAKANEEANKTIAEYEKSLADARATAQAAVINITTRAAQTSLERQAEQQRALTKRLQEAESNIVSARDAALSEARSVVADIAAAALEKIVGAKWPVKP